MKTRLLAATGVALAIAALASTALADKAGDVSSIPVAADNFRLIDHTGYAQEMRRLVDVKAIVLVTQVNGDKVSRKAAQSLAALKAKHPDVEFLMLNSSLKDDRAAIAAEAKAQGFSVPVMDDDVQLVGEQLGVSYAGEAFMLQPKTLKVLYHGPSTPRARRRKPRAISPKRSPT